MTVPGVPNSGPCANCGKDTVEYDVLLSEWLCSGSCYDAWNERIASGRADDYREDA